MSETTLKIHWDRGNVTEITVEGIPYTSKPSATPTYYAVGQRLWFTDSSNDIGTVVAQVQEGYHGYVIVRMEAGHKRLIVLNDNPEYKIYPSVHGVEVVS